MTSRGVAIGAVAAGAVGLVAARFALTRLGRAEPDIDPAPPFVRPDGDEFTVVADDGAELATIALGSGPTVVLCHGWTADLRMWTIVAPQLVTAGFRVVVWDQRGHGRSTVGTDGFGVERLGHDLAAVIEQLDLDDVIVVGHSMGGITAMSLATYCPAVLARSVAGLVLVAAPARAAAAPDLGLALVKVLRSPVFEFLRNRSPRLARAIARRSMGEPITESMIDWSIELFRSCPTSTVVGALEPLLAFDLRATLPGLTTPTFVVTGDRDEVVPASFSIEIGELLPRSQFRMLDGCGHQVPFERPKDLFGAIVALAEDLDQKFGVSGLRRGD